MSEQDLRHEATKRVKAKRGFWQLLGVFVIVWVILIVVWALSGGGYFWPIWAIFGMGIALLFTGWGAFGPANTVSESQVQAEMRRLSGD